LDLEVPNSTLSTFYKGILAVGTDTFSILAKVSSLKTLAIELDAFGVFALASSRGNIDRTGIFQGFHCDFFALLLIVLNATFGTFYGHFHFIFLLSLEGRGQVGDSYGDGGDRRRNFNRTIVGRQ
jgi:hypothetical protein